MANVAPPRTKPPIDSLPVCLLSGTEPGEASSRGRASDPFSKARLLPLRSTVKGGVETSFGERISFWRPRWAPCPQQMMEDRRDRGDKGLRDS